MASYDQLVTAVADCAVDASACTIYISEDIHCDNDDDKCYVRITRGDVTIASDGRMASFESVVVETFGDASVTLDGLQFQKYRSTPLVFNNTGRTLLRNCAVQGSRIDERLEFHGQQYLVFSRAPILQIQSCTFANNTGHQVGESPDFYMEYVVISAIGLVIEDSVFVNNFKGWVPAVGYAAGILIDGSRGNVTVRRTSLYPSTLGYTQPGYGGPFFPQRLLLGQNARFENVTMNFTSGMIGTTTGSEEGNFSVVFRRTIFNSYWHNTGYTYPFWAFTSTGIPVTFEACLMRSLGCPDEFFYSADTNVTVKSGCKAGSYSPGIIRSISCKEDAPRIRLYVEDPAHPGTYPDGFAYPGDFMNSECIPCPTATEDGAIECPSSSSPSPPPTPNPIHHSDGGDSFFSSTSAYVLFSVIALVLVLIGAAWLYVLRRQKKRGGSGHGLDMKEALVGGEAD